jgi:cytochrome c oxidase assembly protein subunit 15
MSPHRRLVLATLILALCVIVVGAYVRLSHAGLGCPDWPLCYGRPMPGDQLGADALGRAWKEMGHRYLAGGLGLLIAALFVVFWRRRAHRALSTALVLVVLLQATLGMWTVTLLLKPAIVAAHLLGGMATLSLLVWLFLALGTYAPDSEARAARWPALAALVAVVAQIALGGWVSANYAALACRDLPLCQGALVPAMDFGHAFHVLRALGETSDGARLPAEALTAIHWTHRAFALVVVATVGWVSFKAFSKMRTLAIGIALLLTLQFLLGVANVFFGLPLALAAAHNAGAALLLASLVVLNFFSFRGLRPTSW